MRLTLALSVALFAPLAAAQSESETSARARVALALSVAEESPYAAHVRRHADDLSPLATVFTAAQAGRALTRSLAVGLSEQDLTAVLTFVRSPAVDRIRLADLLETTRDEPDLGIDVNPGRLAELTADRRDLVRRLAAVHWYSDQEIDLLTRTFEIFERAEPEIHARLVETETIPIALEVARDEERSLPDDRVSMVDALVRDVSDDAIRSVLAFYDSESGLRLVRAHRAAFIALAARASAEDHLRAARSALAPVFDVVDRQPELIGGLDGLQRRVEYPRLARDAGIQGRVFVQFVVDENGRPVDPVVTRTPSDLLSAAALKAVRQSEFIPGSARGRPVRVRYSLPVDFTLD